MKVTEEIFNYWKNISNYDAKIGITVPFCKVSKRTYQKIRSTDSYEEYKKKHCNKKTDNFKKPVNPIQKTYVNLIKKIEFITKEVDKIVAEQTLSLNYLGIFRKDILKTRSLISKLIILDIAITTIGIASLIALIAW